MKRIVIGVCATLFLLIGCGQKKEIKATSTSTSGSQEVLQSTLPVVDNATKNTVVTKKLIFPKDNKGVQQTQIITYKGKEFLTFTIQQIRPIEEDLKNYIAAHGLEEAKKALKDAENQDESVQAARKITGLTVETNLINESEIETKTAFDFQVMDVQKASKTEYLKNVGLENLLKSEPEAYISNQVANGATVQ